MRRVILASVLLFSSALHADHLDINVTGKYQGSFKAPPDIIYANMLWDDFTHNSDSDSLQICLTPSISTVLDTLKIFFTLVDVLSSIDSACVVSSNAETLFVEYGEPQWWPDSGTISGYNVTIPQPLLGDSLFVKFKFCEFTEPDFQVNLICRTNMKSGNSVWLPITVGNIWQYEDKSRESLVPYTHEAYRRYHVTDSLPATDSVTRFLIEETRIADGTTNSSCCDTIYIDELGNFVLSGNSTYSRFYELYPHEYDPGWYDYYVGRWDENDSLSYYLYNQNNYPGGDSYKRYKFGVGLVQFWDITWPWDDRLTTLTGARINGVDTGWFTPLAIDIEEKPENFSLNVRAYPNPFNAGIRFDYDLVKEGVVHLTVYDLLGARVHEVNASNQHLGKNSFYWDGVDQYGGQVPTGIYFMEVKHGSLQQVIKVALVK